MLIVFLDTETVGDLPQLTELKRFGEVLLYPFTTPAQTADRIREADIVLTNKVVLDREALAQATHLKLICVTATGTNNVDSEFARTRGITVKNAAGYAVESVAQHTFALLLTLVEHTFYYDQYVKSGQYAHSRTFTHLGREVRLLSGKQLGIIGLGNIGRGVARIAEAFGMQVMYHSASGHVRPEKYRRVELLELLNTADVVTIHAPLTEQTRNLIQYRHFKQMKPTALLLNTGRGGIVDEAALARALNENLIAGAGTDVFAQEPVQPDNPLLRLAQPGRLVVSPHIAWAARETRELLMTLVLDHIRTFLGSPQGQQ